MKSATYLALCKVASVDKEAGVWNSVGNGIKSVARGVYKGTQVAAKSAANVVGRAGRALGREFGLNYDPNLPGWNNPQSRWNTRAGLVSQSRVFGSQPWRPPVKAAQQQAPQPMSPQQVGVIPGNNSGSVISEPNDKGIYDD